MPKETVYAIGEIANNVNAWILCDEVYRGAELSREECTSFWDIDYDKTIVNCGLSKAYGLPGLRLGWSVSNKQYIQDCWATHDYTTIAIGRLSDMIGAYVLNADNRMKTLNRTRDALSNNLTLFQNWVNTFDGKFKFIPPDAGAMAFTKYDWHINSSVLVEKIREEASVMLVAGDWYGMDHYLRFGYGATASVLEAALDRITPIFKSL